MGQQVNGSRDADAVVGGEDDLGFTPVPPPNVHQRMLLTWAAIWPSVTILTWLLGDRIANWPMPLRTGLITLIVVTACVYVVVPALFKLRVVVLSAYRRRAASRRAAAAA